MIDLRKDVSSKLGRGAKLHKIILQLFSKSFFPHRKIDRFPDMAPADGLSFRFFSQNEYILNKDDDLMTRNAYLIVGLSLDFGYSFWNKPIFR
jgi:hypothetical protein